MDQRTKIGTSLRLERPIHRACVVPGCWCGSTTTAARSGSIASASGSVPRRTRGFEAGSSNLTDIAWRYVGLPVV